MRIHKEYFLNKKLKPLKRIERFYGSTIDTYRKNGFDKGCIMGNFSAEMADVNENFREVLDKEFRAQESIINECIREGQENGDIRKDISSSTMASFVINSWHGSLVRMKATASSKPLDDFLSMIIQFVKS